MVQEGRKLNPTATFHDDIKMLDESYDLVMINGMLQYIEDWKNFLFEIFDKVGDFLFITRLPVVQESKSFVAIQSMCGTEVLHNQLNEREFLDHMQVIGFTLLREVVVGDRPQILNAPEQCELKGWLFKK
jgi:putative methyltransferase (TIGR04325 family)